VNFKDPPQNGFELGIGNRDLFTNKRMCKHKGIISTQSRTVWASIGHYDCIMPELSKSVHIDSITSFGIIIQNFSSLELEGMPSLTTL